MKTTRFAFFGAGFWARYQMAAWKEVPGVSCAAVYNRTPAKGEEFAGAFSVPRAYDDARALLEHEQVDFVDLCTNPFTLPDFVELVSGYGIPVITQKPIAPSAQAAEQLVKLCRDRGSLYLVHENWRWQRLIRELKNALDSGVIGRVFRARLTMVSGFNVYLNEPTLQDLERFVITDIGTHILDTARFLFGEANSLYCLTKRVRAANRGEDAATLMLSMGPEEVAVTIELGYPEHHLENDAFPQTFALVEGAFGSVELARDYWLRVTTKDGTHARRCPPASYPWADPDYLPVHASIVACNEHLLKAVNGETTAETTAEDHLKTIRLTDAAYESAAQRKAILFQPNN
jgi:predicted dehydrogenase